MKKGPSSIWDGRIMPSILRGSTEHNKRVLAERERAASMAQQAMGIKIRKANAKAKTSTSTSTLKSTLESSSSAENAAALNLREAVFAKARAVMAIVEENVKSEAKSEAEVKSEALQSLVEIPSPSSVGNAESSALLIKSKLYCDETFDTPPNSPQRKPLVLSPFSKAKEKAQQLGVVLKEECRGMYDDEGLNRRIEYIAQVNEKLNKRRNNV